MLNIFNLLRIVLLLAACCFRVWLPLKPWRRGRQVPSECPLTFNELHSIIPYTTVWNPFYNHTWCVRVPDSVRRLGYGLGDLRIWVRCPEGTRNLCDLHGVQMESTVHPAFCLMLPGFPSTGVKQQLLVGDWWPPSSSEIKNGWSCTSIPPFIYIVTM
jgi:hypothetical protein